MSLYMEAISAQQSVKPLHATATGFI